METQTAAPKRELRNVFISYASPDRKFALRLKGDLVSAGVTTWIADHGIDPGEEWARVLEDALRASAVVVLVVSRASRASRYVRQELHFADAHQAALIPIRIGKCGPWFEISALQEIDFTEYYDEGLAKLLDRPVPRRTVPRKCWIFLKKNRIPAYALATILAASYGVYRLMPSNTSFSVIGGDANGMVVNVHNGGGQPSLLAGDRFVLDFGTLPIEAQKLVLQDPHGKSRVPGHSDVQIRLTSPAPLTPKAHPGQPYFFYNEQEIAPLLARATLTVHGEVRESNEQRLKRVDTFAAKTIETFIYEEFPDVVSRLDLVP